MARMEVHALVAAGGDPVLEDVDEVLLERLEAGHGLVEGTLLGDDGAGGVVGVDHHDAVPDAGGGGDLLDAVRHIVEADGAVPGLDLECFAVTHRFFLLTSGP